MEGLIRQTRVKLYGRRDEKKEESSRTRDGKIQPQRSQSFREKRRSQSWIRKRQLSWDYDYSGVDYPAAVAAAASAIHSLEESITTDQNQKPDYKTVRPTPSIKKTPTFSDKKNSHKHEEALPVQPKKAPIAQPAGRTPSFPDRQVKRTVSKKSEAVPSPPVVQPVERRLEAAKPGAGVTEAEAWEKSEMARIEQRHQKWIMKIQNWEVKKKKKAKNKLDRTEAELDRRRTKAVMSYNIEIKRIDEVAKGASAKANKNRVDEENKVKQKANKMRSTGRLPVTCLCF